MPEASGSENGMTSEASSSGLFGHFARALWSERIRRGLDRTLFGPGSECEPLSATLDTVCSPFDSERVALGLTINGTACSCSPNYCTPVASDHKGSTGKGSRRGTLVEQLAMSDRGGLTCYPHPEFVEALMGFPVGWSALLDSETPSMCELPNGSDAD